MSKFLDQYVKQAMWEEHKKKCFYCAEPLSFKNIHVDHIIPQIAFEKDKRSLRKKYGLGEDFDFNSLDNFVPSCPSCNSNRKGHRELENGIPLWLNEAKNKRSNIIKRSKKLKIELSLDLPDQYKEFFLSSPDFMLSQLSLEKIRKTDIELYKNLAFSSDFYPLHLTSPEDENIKIPITNLSQYKIYSDKGFYGYTTPEIDLCGVCDACLNFFEKFESAIGLKEKFNFIDYYRSLPAIILHTIGPEEDCDFKNYDTIGDYINAHENIEIDLNNDKVKMVIIHKEYNEDEIYIMKELLQADFTGDGNSESIIFIYYRSGGTFHYTFSIQAAYLNGRLVLQ